MEEKLFKAKERIMELSFAHDVLYDSVSGLEQRLHDCRKNCKKLEKKYNALVKLHSKCKNETLYFYR